MIKLVIGISAMALPALSANAEAQQAAPKVASDAATDPTPRFAKASVTFDYR